ILSRPSPVRLWPHPLQLPQRRAHMRASPLTPPSPRPPRASLLRLLQAGWHPPPLLPPVAPAISPSRCAITSLCAKWPQRTSHRRQLYCSVFCNGLCVRALKSAARAGRRGECHHAQALAAPTPSRERTPVDRTVRCFHRRRAAAQPHGSVRCIAFGVLIFASD